MPNTRSDSSVRTVNAHRYDSANARVKLNPDGFPVAFRRVVSLKPSGAAGHKYQLLRPSGITALTPEQAQRAVADCTPLN